MTNFLEVSPEPYEPEEQTGKRYGNRGIPSPQCPSCGRFSKASNGRHYYNGQYNCYSYDTYCDQCGTLTVECV